MPGKKSSFHTSKYSPSFDINQIPPELRADYERINYHIQHQVFFHPDLNYQQCMFLLNHPDAIEKEFLLYLYDSIQKFNISEDLRDTLYRNLNKSSEELILIGMYSGINQHHNTDNDSDDEEHVETSSSIDSEANNTYNDLENQILDEIEFENDLPAFNPAPIHEEPSTEKHYKDN